MRCAARLVQDLLIDNYCYLQYKKRHPSIKGCPMVSFLTSKRPGRPPKTSRMTAVSFSAADLAALGHLVAFGQAILRKRPPVVVRLKAAKTRMGVPFPEGL